MKITIINSERNEKRYTRENLDDYVAQLREGTYRQYYANNLKKEVCFAAEWSKTNGELKVKALNPLVLLSIENLRDLPTVEEYKRRAIQQPYTVLCFIGHDGHSLHIVCRYDATPTATTLLNAFRKYHYIYSSQLGTPLADVEPTFETCCKACYDPQPFFNPEAIAIQVSDEPEETPEFRSQQENISDSNYPEEIPGLSVHESRMRRFHDCLDNAIEKYRDSRNDELFATAVLEHLANGCHLMGLPQAWCVRIASFMPLFTEQLGHDIIESVFKTA